MSDQPTAGALRAARLLLAQIATITGTEVKLAEAKDIAEWAPALIDRESGLAELVAAVEMASKEQIAGDPTSVPCRTGSALDALRTALARVKGD